MDIKYIVKPEERMVIGLCNVTNREVIEKLGTHLDPYIWDNWWEMIYNFEPEKITLRAIARCDERDEFDEEYGKKLVRAKLVYKYDKLALSYADKIIEKFAKKFQNFRRNAYVRLQNAVDMDVEDLRDYYGLKV